MNRVGQQSRISVIAPPRSREDGTTDISFFVDCSFAHEITPHRHRSDQDQEGNARQDDSQHNGICMRIDGGEMESKDFKLFDL